MLLPTTYTITIALIFLSILCWGFWASTFKKSLWRFELYYIDFSLGTVLAALLAAFTVGSMGSDISVEDTFLLVGKKQILLAFGAGCLFNLANMLIVAGVEMAGMSVAFPVGIGLALIVGAIWNYFAQQAGSAAMVFGGVALVLISVILSAVAHGKMQAIRKRAAAALAAEMQPPEEDPKLAASNARRKKAAEEAGPGAYRGVWLAIAGGMLLGTFYPVMMMSTEGELGISNPFAVTLIFSIGILLSTFIYNLYFMNLPVKGLPISFFAYFTGSMGQHAMGLLGGMIWMIGACANFSAGAAQGEAKLGAWVSYAFGQGAVLVSLICGMMIWKEFSGADGGTKRLLGILSLLFLIGLGLSALAPLN